MKNKKPTGLRGAISSFLIKRGFNQLTRRIAKLPEMTPEQAVTFAFSKDAELIRPWQFEEELTGLASEIRNQKASTIMEIGTANGGTLFIATRMAKEDALIISLDLPQGQFGGGYPEWKVPVYSRFARPGQDLHLLRADSHLDSSLEKVRNILNGRKLDYLLIDGDHTYEGVKQDFEMYSPFVRPGGIVAFHDIVEHGGSSCKVDLFWQEIKQRYPHREYVRDWKQGKFGVGIITV